MNPKKQIPSNKSFDYHLSKQTKITVIVINIIGLLPVLLFLSLAKSAENGMVGTEFIGMALAPLLFATLAALIFDFLISLKYLLKNHSNTLNRIFALVIIICCGAFLGYEAIGSVNEARNHYHYTHLSLNESTKLIINCKVSRIIRRGDSTDMFVTPGPSDYQYAAVQSTDALNFPILKQVAKEASKTCNSDIAIVDNNYVAVRSYITETEAINLLNTCEINAFYYNDNRHNLLDEPIQPGTYTGIQLRKDFEYNEMYITDKKLEPKFVTIAHQAQKSCPKLTAFNNEDPLEDPNYYQ
jgi:hypothetical protein